MRRCFIMIFIFVFLLGSLPACGTSTSPPVTPVPPTPIVAQSHPEPAPPMAVTLTLSKAPRTGEVVDVSLKFQCIYDAAGTQAELILPDGATLVKGDLKWSGDLKANQPVSIHASIQFGKEGNQELSGRALSKQPNGDVWADQASIYLNITENQGSVGYK